MNEENTDMSVPQEQLQRQQDVSDVTLQISQQDSDATLQQDSDITLLAEEIETAGDSREKRHEIYKERIKHFILMNDPLMRVVFDDDATVEYLLRLVMKKPDLKVVSRNIQADYKNLEGRSVVLDIVAVDYDGVIYNIEIQQKSEGAVPERARYNAGMMDSKELHENEDFTKLPNSYIIFITGEDETDNILSNETIKAVVDSSISSADGTAADEATTIVSDFTVAVDCTTPAAEEQVTQDDVSEVGKMVEEPYIHRIVRVDEATGRIFKDRQTIIYINSQMPAVTDLGKLMHDFHCENPDDMLCEPIARRVRMIKESSEEVEHMCMEMDKVYNDGARREKVRTAMLMVNDGMPTESVVKYSGLSFDEVHQLEERKKSKEALQTA